MMKVILLTYVFSLGLLPHFYGSENIHSKIYSLQDDPQAILKKLESFYTSHAYIYQELQYDLYSTSNYSTPESTEKGVFIKKGAIQYSLLGPVEQLTTTAYTLVIDQEEKMMMISNLIQIPATSPIQEYQNLPTSGTKANIKALTINKSELQFQIETGEIAECRLEYNTQTYEILKLVLYYRRKIQLSSDGNEDPIAPRLEVLYSNTSFEERNSEKLKLTSYVYGEGDHWRPSAQYQDYEFINNIKQNPYQN